MGWGGVSEGRGASVGRGESSVIKRQKASRCHGRMYRGRRRMNNGGAHCRDSWQGVMELEAYGAHFYLKPMFSPPPTHTSTHTLSCSKATHTGVTASAEM